VQQAGGNLAGNNVINGGLTWVSGEWNNANVTITTNSTVDIAGGAGVNDLAVCNMTNYGTVVWSSGTMRVGGCSGGTTIYNYGLWDSQGDLVMNDAYGCSGGVFNNFGTLRKSAGVIGNSMQIQNGITFNSSGIVDVRSGTLSLQSGGSFSGGTVTNNAGILQLASGFFNINGTATSVSVQQAGANQRRVYVVEW
jgi:hypothetical protein